MGLFFVILAIFLGIGVFAIIFAFQILRLLAVGLMMLVLFALIGM